MSLGHDRDNSKSKFHTPEYVIGEQKVCPLRSREGAF